MEKVVSDRQAALAAADLKLARTEKDRQALAAIVEARFAGIELTGQRVIFLVDTSGSMEMLDDNTTAPNKWAEVCVTVEKVIRSLPKLEKYQIIAFGPKFDYPMGNAGKWLDLDVKTRPEAARKALAEKLVHLRVFEDAGGRMNRSLLETGGTLGVVSQFTLLADARRGRRPSFVEAAPPEAAEPLVEAVVGHARAVGVAVVTGRFRARMDVTLVNAGPVTLLLDTRGAF